MSNIKDKIFIEGRIRSIKVESEAHALRAIPDDEPFEGMEFDEESPHPRDVIARDFASGQANCLLKFVEDDNDLLQLLKDEANAVGLGYNKDIHVFE